MIFPFRQEDEFLGDKFRHFFVSDDDGGRHDDEEHDAGNEELDDVKVVTHPFAGQEDVAQHEGHERGDGHERDEAALCVDLSTNIAKTFLPELTAPTLA